MKLFIYRLLMLSFSIALLSCAGQKVSQYIDKAAHDVIVRENGDISVSGNKGQNLLMVHADALIKEELKDEITFKDTSVVSKDDSFPDSLGISISKIQWESQNEKILILLKESQLGVKNEINKRKNQSNFYLGGTAILSMGFGISILVFPSISIISGIGTIVSSGFNGLAQLPAVRTVSTENLLKLNDNLKLSIGKFTFYNVIETKREYANWKTNVDEAKTYYGQAIEFSGKK